MAGLRGHGSRTRRLGPSVVSQPKRARENYEGAGVWSTIDVEVKLCLTALTSELPVSGKGRRSGKGAWRWR